MLDKKKKKKTENCQTNQTIIDVLAHRGKVFYFADLSTTISFQILFLKGVKNPRYQIELYHESIESLSATRKRERMQCLKGY